MPGRLAPLPLGHPAKISTHPLTYWRGLLVLHTHLSRLAAAWLRGGRGGAGDGRSVAEDVTVAEVEDWAGGLEKLLARIGPRFARSEPRARAGVYLRGCCRRRNARTAGRWPSRPGTPRPMRCSACSTTPTGTPTPCAMTCAPTSWSTSATTPRCWSSTRPDS